MLRLPALLLALSLAPAAAQPLFVVDDAGPDAVAVAELDPQTGVEVPRARLSPAMRQNRAGVYLDAAGAHAYVVRLGGETDAVVEIDLADGSERATPWSDENGPLVGFDVRRGLLLQLRVGLDGGVDLIGLDPADGSERAVARGLRWEGELRAIAAPVLTDGDAFVGPTFDTDGPGVLHTDGTSARRVDTGAARSLVALRGDRLVSIAHVLGAGGASQTQWLVREPRAGGAVDTLAWLGEVVRSGPDERLVVPRSAFAPALYDAAGDRLLLGIPGGVLAVDLGGGATTELSLRDGRRLTAPSGLAPPVAADAAPDPLRLLAAPNPARDRLTLSLGTAGPAAVSAFDALGRRVLHRPAVHGHDTLDVSGLTPGVYVIVARGDGKEARVRVTISR